jgi:microcystin-dependent protein
MPLTPFVGQIMPAGFGIIPKGWALCNGAIFPIQQYQALFSLLGVTYGGDGIRTFALPDLRGRAIMGSNLGSVPPGQISGTENVTLTSQQLPSHNHLLQAATTEGGGRGGIPPVGHLFGTNKAPANSIFQPVGGTEIALAPSTNVAPAGGNQFHNNMQPYLAVNYLIAISGIYPPRP